MFRKRNSSLNLRESIVHANRGQLATFRGKLATLAFRACRFAVVSAVILLNVVGIQLASGQNLTVLVNGSSLNSVLFAVPGEAVTVSIACANPGPSASGSYTCLSSAVIRGKVISDQQFQALPLTACAYSVGSSASSLAAGGNVTCTVTYNIPGSPGGSQSTAGYVSIIGSVNSGSSGVSQQVDIFIVDAVDSVTTLDPGNNSAFITVYPGANDWVGNGSGVNSGSPADSKVEFVGALPSGVTSGVGLFNVFPETAPGTYQLGYRLCNGTIYRGSQPIGTVCDAARHTLIVPVDTIPFPLPSNNAVGVMPSTNIDYSFTVAGFNTLSPISITGGSYQLGGCSGSFTSATGTVTSGATVCVRVISPSTSGSTASATLSIGGVTANYTAQTRNFVAAPTCSAAAVPTTISAGQTSTLTANCSAVANGTTRTYGWSGPSLTFSGVPPFATSAQTVVSPTSSGINRYRTPLGMQR